MQKANKKEPDALVFRGRRLIYDFCMIGIGNTVISGLKPENPDVTIQSMKLKQVWVILPHE